MSVHRWDLLGNVRFQNPQFAKMSECPQCYVFINPADCESYMHDRIVANMIIFPGTARHIAVVVRRSREKQRDIISKDYEQHVHLVS